MNRLGATSEWYTLAEALDELGVTHGIQIEAGLSGGTLPWRISIIRFQRSSVYSAIDSGHIAESITPSYGC
jgi:hypothetical protein